MLVGLIALVGAIHGRGAAAYATFGFVAAVAGAAAGAYHVWLQSDPVRAAKCIGSPVELILDKLAIGKLAPGLLQYDGPCTLKPWSFLGLSIPEWSTAWFVILAIAFLAIALDRPPLTPFAARDCKTSSILAPGRCAAGASRYALALATKARCRPRHRSRFQRRGSFRGCRAPFLFPTTAPPSPPPS